MAPASLAGVDLKLGRAKECLATLHAERSRFLELHRNRVVHHYNADQTSYVFRVEGELPPLALGITIGEFAHALRSALDNLLWQLILARDGTPVEGVTQFPINEDEADFEGKPRRKGLWATEADRLTDGVLPEYRTFIKSAQPFNTGTNCYRRADPAWDELAMLAHVNNVDKHRFVHAAFAAAAVPLAPSDDLIVNLPAMQSTFLIQQTPGTSGSLRPVFPNARLFDVERLVGGWPWTIRATPQTGILGIVAPSPNPDDPAEIARIAGVFSSFPQPNMQVYPPLTLEISLSDRERPMTIFDFEDILAKVERIVDHFRPAFSS